MRLRFLRAWFGGRARPITVFLDIDGVLHPGFRGSLERLPIFLRLLDRYPQIEVVISSDWRRGRPLSELRGLFPKRHQARIVGMTPEIDHQKRWREILAYIAQTSVGLCLVIDDSEDLFRGSDNLNLYITSRDTGLTEADYDNLVTELDRLGRLPEA